MAADLGTDVQFYSNLRGPTKAARSRQIVEFSSLDETTSNENATFWVDAGTHARAVKLHIVADSTIAADASDYYSIELVEASAPTTDLLTTPITTKADSLNGLTAATAQSEVVSVKLEAGKLYLVNVDRTGSTATTYDIGLLNVSVEVLCNL